MIESLMILLFELIGTAMLTMLFIAVTPNAIPGVGSLGAVGLGMFIGFFILLILSARISGSHYNPIVTLAFMLRKDAGQFNKWLGILYMLFQLGGAILGTIAAFYLFSIGNGTRNFLSVRQYVVQAMVAEIVGSFVLVLMYLTQTEERYKLSNDAAITLLMISASYTVGMALQASTGLNWSQSPLNPAIALAEISFATFNGEAGNMNFAWIYLVFSWVGSLLAVIMYELGFKRAQDAIGIKEEREEEAELGEEINMSSQPLME